MRASINEHTNSMQGRQGRQIKRVVALPREINVHLVEDAIAEVCLLVQWTLCGIALSLGEKRQ